MFNRFFISRLFKPKGSNMSPAPLVKDNITELLVKVIEFTNMRHEILSHNIRDIRKNGFIPKDLEVKQFSNVMNFAIAEYVKNQRLLFQDTGNIKFGFNGSFKVQPVLDKEAMELLAISPDRYLEMQIEKLWENSLNRKIATELLKQRQHMTVIKQLITRQNNTLESDTLALNRQWP